MVRVTKTREIVMTWLAAAVAPLNHVVFNLGKDAVSWAELLGFLTGAVCVWLTVRSRISNFPVGIANSAFFLVLFAATRLWADSALQIIYIVLGFVGWWQWLRGPTTRTFKVARASRASLASCLVFVVLGTYILTVILRGAHDGAPFWDALTTCLSLAAQWLLNAKRVETWFFWIAADCVYIPLYMVKRLDLTAIVYAIFLGMCLAGLRAWLATYRTEQRHVEAAVTTALVADPV
jgi:nicotinamide mononucleotide transporter